MEGRLKNIKAFLFDVDGVFTDGGLLADLNGEFYRTFNSKDGFAVRMAVMHGYHVGIITGGRSESIRMRFLACGFKDEDIYLNARNKIVDFEDFCSKHGLKPEEVMYLGDDIPDIPVMAACGFGAAPSDSVDEVLQIADYVCTKQGGKGCVRECLELAMKAQNEWHLDVQVYEKKF